MHVIQHYRRRRRRQFVLLLLACLPKFSRVHNTHTNICCYCCSGTCSIAQVRFCIYLWFFFRLRKKFSPSCVVPHWITYEYTAKTHTVRGTFEIVEKTYTIYEHRHILTPASTWFAARASILARLGWLDATKRTNNNTSTNNNNCTYTNADRQPQYYHRQSTNSRYV